MPKESVDYSQTIIYKIFCKNKLIEDVYIGHTTNFVKRKYQHKLCCQNGNKLNIYDVIRSNGGWENWDMVEIAKYNCKDSTEARIKEQYHYELHKNLLNDKTPYSDLKKYYCSKCDIQCVSASNYKRHIESKNHKDVINCYETCETNLVPKSSEKFVCIKCDYTTCRKSQFTRHLKTVKHINTENETAETFLVPKSSEKFQCVCGIIFNSRTTLWRHKKSCNFENMATTESNQLSNTVSDKELIMMLVKQNTELMEIVKNGTNNTTNNTNTNCMNKTFNLQFFLNETCKDAMNIMDFVDSIKLQLTDLEKFGEVGYVENLSNIITTNLKALDVTQRPVHCTDRKRETIYIKDENKWEKEDENKTKLRTAIKRIANKNIKLLPQYREKYPGCQYADSRYSDKYNKTVVEAMGGAGNNDVEKEDKIIHNISKNVVIEK
jgi:hypothetical protein